MPIADSAEARKSVSGIPCLIPGVTSNALKDTQWRLEVAWSYYASIPSVALPPTSPGEREGWAPRDFGGSYHY